MVVLATRSCRGSRINGSWTSSDQIWLVTILVKDIVDNETAIVKTKIGTSAERDTMREKNIKLK
jgi:hypothetical protein